MKFLKLFLLLFGLSACDNSPDFFMCHFFSQATDSEKTIFLGSLQREEKGFYLFRGVIVSEAGVSEEFQMKGIHVVPNPLCAGDDPRSCDSNIPPESHEKVLFYADIITKADESWIELKSIENNFSLPIPPVGYISGEERTSRNYVLSQFKKFRSFQPRHCTELSWPSVKIQNK